MWFRYYYRLASSGSSVSNGGLPSLCQNCKAFNELLTDLPSQMGAAQRGRGSRILTTAEGWACHSALKGLRPDKKPGLIRRSPMSER